MNELGKVLLHGRWLDYGRKYSMLPGRRHSQKRKYTTGVKHCHSQFKWDKQMLPVALMPHLTASTAETMLLRAHVILAPLSVRIGRSLGIRACADRQRMKKPTRNG